MRFKRVKVKVANSQAQSDWCSVQLSQQYIPVTCAQLCSTKHMGLTLELSPTKLNRTEQQSCLYSAECARYCDSTYCGMGRYVSLAPDWLRGTPEPQLQGDRVTLKYHTVQPVLPLPAHILLASDWLSMCVIHIKYIEMHIGVYLYMTLRMFS